MGKIIIECNYLTKKLVLGKTIQESFTYLKSFKSRIQWSFIECQYSLCFYSFLLLSLLHFLQLLGRPVSEGDKVAAVPSRWRQSISCKHRPTHPSHQAHRFLWENQEAGADRVQTVSCSHYDAYTLHFLQMEMAQMWSSPRLSGETQQFMSYEQFPRSGFLITVIL